MTWRKQAYNKAGRTRKSHLAWRVREGHWEQKDRRAGQEEEPGCGEEREELSRWKEGQWKGPGGSHGLGTREASQEASVAAHRWGGHRRGQQGLRTQGLGLSTQALGLLLTWIYEWEVVSGEVPTN